MSKDLVAAYLKGPAVVALYVDFAVQSRGRHQAAASEQPTD